MRRPSKFSLSIGFVALGASVAFLRLLQAQPQSTTPDVKPADLKNEIVALRVEVDRLKGMVPDQSHAMKDVAYHFGNLWFAGQQANWPLADFYWSETRSHLRWAVRIIPVRKDPQGNDIRLAEILEPIEKTSLQKVGDAIKAKDGAGFAQAYRQMLDSCYACHLAAGKPFLRLQVPQQPEVPIIRFDPVP
ncbi:MAG TPA: hypothetical protein VLU94_00730 [Candidatus Nitrosotalea sp.]|nr:hypothetical protein [Candidatus Nitrosotalea sp.]